MWRAVDSCTVRTGACRGGEKASTTLEEDNNHNHNNGMDSNHNSRRHGVVSIVVNVIVGLVVVSIYDDDDDQNRFMVPLATVAIPVYRLSQQRHTHHILPFFPSPNTEWEQFDEFYNYPDMT